MMSTEIYPPPPATFETTTVIVQRHGHYEDPDNQPDWVTKSQKHCELMAPMGNDKRIQYLQAVGCDDQTRRFITESVAETIGNAAKPDLRSAVRECATAKKDIHSLLGVWPEPHHFQLLSSALAGMTDEQKSLANAYAACQIYETAAAALYLAIIDNLPPVEDVLPYSDEMRRQDQEIADSGYEDEVAKWPQRTLGRSDDQPVGKLE